MNRLKFARIAAAALAVAASSTAFADSQNLVVTANVAGVCKLNTIPGMTFALDPTVGTNQTQTTTVSYKCTKGTAPTSMTVGGALAAAGYSGTLTGPSAMPYTIAWTAPATAGSGLGSAVTAVNVTLTGSILGTDYVNAAAGAYTETIAVVIVP